jgi:glycosyltransferase involved in cell wall biosynthesis
VTEPDGTIGPMHSGAPRVVFLHESGAPAHVAALSHLAQRGAIRLEFAEYRLARTLAKAVRAEGPRALARQAASAARLARLYLRPGDETVVLGVAPFDPRLVLLEPALRGRRVVVLNSWIGWDEAAVPHPLRSERVRDAWRRLGARALFVGVSPASADGARAVFERTSYIPHSVPMPARPRPADPAPGGPLRLVYIGRLAPAKGVHELLELVDRLGSAVTLEVVGYGPLAGEVRRRAWRDPRVTFRGRITDPEAKTAILHRADLLVLPSKRIGTWEETFGLVVIEALAHGVPVVMSPLRGPCSVHRGEGERFVTVARSHQSADLADAVRAASAHLADSSLREGAVRYAREQFSTARVAEHWLKIVGAGWPATARHPGADRAASGATGG